MSRQPISHEASTRPSAGDRRGHTPRAALLWLLLMLVLVACGGSEAQSQVAEPPPIRTPRPTFTPTVNQAPAQLAPAQPVATPAAPAAPVENPPAALLPTGAKAIVNTPLVNARRGPSVEAEVIAIVERGQEFDILAKDDTGEWWQVCCINDQPAWISGELVDTEGPVDVVPVFGQAPAAPAPAVAPAVPPVAAATPAASGDFPFNLVVQEQFPKAGGVRIYLFVFDGVQALEGYRLRVWKDKAEQLANAVSFGGQPGFTWPFQDARQRSQNLKLEFPLIAPAGVWEVQLVDQNGAAVGPVATFTLVGDDPNQELYVRYERR